MDRPKMVDQRPSGQAANGKDTVISLQGTAVVQCALTNRSSQSLADAMTHLTTGLRNSATQR